MGEFKRMDSEYFKYRSEMGWDYLEANIWEQEDVDNALGGMFHSNFAENFPKLTQSMMAQLESSYNREYLEEHGLLNAQIVEKTEWMIKRYLKLPPGQFER